MEDLIMLSNLRKIEIGNLKFDGIKDIYYQTPDGMSFVVGYLNFNAAEDEFTLCTYGSRLFDLSWKEQQDLQWILKKVQEDLNETD